MIDRTPNYPPPDNTCTNGVQNVLAVPFQSLMTRADLAKRFNVCPQTILNWEKEGLPRVNIVKVVRYHLPTVLDWVRRSPKRILI